MIKKFGIIFFITLFFAFALAFNTSAEAPPIQPSQSWKCLKGTPIQFTGTANTSLTEELIGDGFPVDSTVYIVSCVGTAAGAICTTTNPAYDEVVFRANNTIRFPFSVTIAGNSKQRVSFGKLKTTVTVPTSQVTGLISFYGVVIGDPLVVKGDQKSLQQGTIPLVDTSVTSCASISWTIVPPPQPTQVPIERCHDSRENEQTEFCQRNDPFGFIFDSRSLEPLPNVEVTVLDKNKKRLELLGLTNPQTTRADGLFNFLVEPGTYYLTVVTPKGYAFTASPNLHPNYSRIYHKIDGSSSIYKPDEPIVEDQTPEHRDIPLDPGTGKPFTAQPSNIVYEIIRLVTTTKIEGRVSHPYTEVSFLQRETLLAKTTADRFGIYRVYLDNEKLKQDEDISIFFTKVDLTTYGTTTPSPTISPTTLNNGLEKILSSIINYVSSRAVAQTISISPSPGLSLPPIPSYIEGYAYDKNNVLLPSSKVVLKLKMNNAVYYQTQTNEKGYFLIPSENTPIFPYYLEIAPKGGTSPITYSTSQFAKKNKTYLAEKKSMSAPSPFLSSSQGLSNISPKQKPTSIPLTTPSSSPTLLLVTVVVLFLILVGLIAFFVVKLRQNIIPPPTIS